MRLGINGRFYAARITGVQRFAREVCARLYESGDNVLLLPADAPMPDRLTNRVAVLRGRLRGNAWEQIELPRLARAARCSIVLNPANSAPYSGGPHVVVLHDVLPLTHPEWFATAYTRWHRHVIRRAVRRAVRVITCSQWSAAQIERVCDIPRDRISIVTQGLAPFAAPADHAWTNRVVNGFDLRAPYLLCVGSDRRKNVEFLFPIMDELRREVRPDLLLVIAGGTEARVHGTSTVAAREYVRCIPDVSDQELHALYTGAAALCFPSLAEGFGRPPLEAIACGTPAVVSSYGPAEEVLGAAAPILPLQPEAWVNAVRDILQSKRAHAERLALHAELLQRYDWSIAAQQVLEACVASPRTEVFA
jgi:glycosyltransferase involved in cell wall biosynthesis